MKQKRTRLLSLLLCCFLLVGLLPVIASAASSGGGEIKVYKVDENGQPLAGATFVLKVDKDGVAGEPAYEAVSDEEGLVTFTEVLPGSYILAESAAPTGYVKSDVTYSLYVNEDGGVILFTAEAPNGTAYSPVTYTNAAEPAPVSVTITANKVDQKGKPLAGATFVLNVDKDGVAGEAAYEAVSDEKGLVTFTEVLPGSYILAESAAPAGYVKSDDTYSLYVNEDGRVILFTEEAPNGTEYTPVTIANQAKSANSGPVNTGDASLLPVLGTLLISGAASIVLLKLRKRWA